MTTRPVTENVWMMQAERNLAICEAVAAGDRTLQQIAEDFGLASKSQVHAIKTRGIDHWREWQRRAEEVGVGLAAPAANGAAVNGQGIQLIPIDRIRPNPWQPRQTINPNTIRDRADDIYANGLLSPILVRYGGDDEYELVYGQYRLESFRYLHDMEWAPPYIEGGSRWTSEYFDGETTSIPAIVRVMSDQEVILASLSENAQREDLNWLDESRSLKRALDAGTGLSQSELARVVGISRSNMSERLALLRLPDRVLEAVASEEMSWTTARLLLGFVGDGHVHHVELDRVMDAVGNASMSRDAVGSVVEDLLLNHRGIDGMSEWRVLEADDFSPHLPPGFDRQKFIDDHSDHVHRLPAGIGTMLVTCRGKKLDGELSRLRVKELQPFDGVLTENIAQNEEESPVGPKVLALQEDYDYAQYLPQGILAMYEEGRLEEQFVIDLLGFIDSPYHVHAEHLEAIADELRRIAKFKSPGKPMTSAAAGGVVLRMLGKDIGGWKFRSLDDRLTHFGWEPPRFDVSEFLAQPNVHDHLVPIGTGLVRVTCAFGHWTVEQQAHDRSVADQVAKGNEPSPPDEPAAQLQDMAMADVPVEAPAIEIPEDELLEEPAREVSNCAYNLPTLQDHWHVEWPSTLRRYVKQSPAFVTYEEAVAYRKKLSLPVQPRITRHQYR